MCAAKFFKGGELKEKLVIDQKASVIGKVEDTVITEAGKLGLLVKHDGVENIILYDQVKKIDDVVLLRIELNLEVEDPPVAVVEEMVVEEEVEEVEEVGDVFGEAGLEVEASLGMVVEEAVEEMAVEGVGEGVGVGSEVLLVEAVSSNICSNCGMANRAGMNFCTKCGNSLK
jgi:sporulation protein YlmC with PRC-barrel domain